MAEEKTPSPESETPKKTKGGGSKMLPLILTAVISSVLGAGIVFFVPVHHPEKDPLTVKTDEAAKKALEPKFSVTTLELMFNPNEKRRSRTCRINMSFQFVAKDPEAAEKLILDSKESAKSELIIYLSDRKLEEVQGSENLTILRKELRERLEKIFFPKGEARLNDVFFTDVLVQ